MKNQGKKVVLLTGASSGIGAVCVKHLAGCGYQVYGTSRQVRTAEGFTMLPMDVTDEDSVQQAVQQVVERESRLDVLINNAGMGYGGSVEDTSHAEAQRTFDINFFGALRVCRAVLPVMRQQRSGLIINVSSLGGVVGMPYQGLYSASKFALEGVSEALRIEVKPFGIHVVLLEPGDIHTEFTAHRVHTAATQTGSVYRDTYKCVLERIESDEQHGADPEVVAKTVARIVAHPSPRLRYVTGPFYEGLIVWVKRLTPGSFLEWVMRTMYGL